VLHAFQLAETLVAAGEYDEVGQVEESLRGQLSESLARWHERYQSVQVATEVVREHPVEALAAASHQADLVVVGARGRSALQGLLLGSVSHGLIHHAACPVAVVGPRD
jgi:nucleotide-binding universal stress UspA family protein